MESSFWQGNIAFERQGGNKQYDPFIIAEWKSVREEVMVSEASEGGRARLRKIVF